MSPRAPPIMVFGLTLALLFLSVNNMITVEGANEEELYAHSDAGTASTRSYQAPQWPEPPLEQFLGDDFNERAIFVHQNDSTYLDDLLFTAAIPAAVHWEGSTRFDSMIISDAKIRENGNLIGDYSEYLRKIEATPDIDFIGSVPEIRQKELSGYFRDVESSVTVTASDSVYEGVADIARYYWQNQRNLGTDTAVLAYVPEMDGGTEGKKISTGVNYGQFQSDNQVNSLETSWLRFSIEWDDPFARSDYRLGVRDPYALQTNLYSNLGEAGHVNPTDNKLFDHEGYAEIGMSPFYSYMPYSVDSSPQQSTNRQFTAVLPDGDNSVWPLPGGSDYSTFEFGPVKKGQWIGVITNWTFYDVNETIYRDFNTYIYGPGQEVGPEYLLEIATNDGTYSTNVRSTPEIGYCYADRDGYYKVTVHPYHRSVGGRFHTGVYWGSLDGVSTWSGYQLNYGNDPVNHRTLEYSYLDDVIFESVTNAAVVASLENVPLLYTAGSIPEEVVVATLEEMGITNLIIIDPAGKISASLWETEGFDITSFQTDVDVFNHIYDISSEKGLDRSLVVTAVGGPWFSGAALGGAYHGAPVPILDDTLARSLQIKATTMWWQVIQDATVFHKAPTNRYTAPSQTDMEKLSDDFFEWISGFNEDFDPDCGDADGNGIPDNGRNWDYSDDVDVLVVSPMNAIKPVLDRAISGKASVGRITPAEPEVLWAVLNREMLYWKVGFSRAENPQNADDTPAAKDHWNIVGWTFNTYAHDDDIMDNDAGDIDDDDWCGADDGGANHLQYKTREDLPSYAESSGRTSQYHTYYDNILDMLEDGTLLWSNHGHGHTYWMLETGPGYTGTGIDPSDPPWGEPVPDNGFVNPPLETTSGWDWYYGIDSVHSTFSTYQSCQVGGSAMSEYFLRMGGIGVIGGFVTRSLIEATVQSDRTTKGLLVDRMTFGEAHRWGQDEIGCIYSLDDPGPVYKTYAEMGTPDDVDWRYGDTGQTILYGDPSLRILSRTLFISTDIHLDITGEEVIVDIFVTDQSGNPVNPDVVLIDLDGEMVQPAGLEAGRLRSVLPIDEALEAGSFSLDMYDSDFLSPEGSHHFGRNYDISFPEIDLVPGDLRYIGGMEQRIRSNGPPCFLNFGPITLDQGDLNSFTVSVMKEEGVFTGIRSNITFDGDSWVLDDLNVSGLFEGEFYLELVLRVKYNPPVLVRGPSFRIEHELYFKDGAQSLDEDNKVLILEGLKVMSTFIGHSPITDELLDRCGYEVFTYSEVKLGQIGYTGDLAYDPASMTFGFSRDLSELPLGLYRFNVVADSNYTGERVMWSDVFSLDVPVQISDFKVRYTGGMQQVLEVSDIRFYLTYDKDEEVPMNEVVSADCDILYEDLEPTGISEEVPRMGGGWADIRFNISSLEEGRYIARVRVRTISFGSNEAVSDPFKLVHEAKIIPPSITYDIVDHTLDFTDIRVVSSYTGSEIMVVKMDIMDPSNDVVVDVTGSLRYFGGTWSIRDIDASSLLPEGDDYFLKMTFWVDGDLVEGSSEPFTVNYELVISTPSIRFIDDHDVLEVSNIMVTSLYKGGRQVTPASLEISFLRVYNSSSGELLHEQNLLYTGGTFGCEISRPMERFGAGEVDLEITFATALSGNHSLRSERFILREAVDDIGPDDDDSVEDANGGGVEWYLIVIVVLIILILVVFLMILVSLQVKWKRAQEAASVAPVASAGARSLPLSFEMKESLPPRPREALPEVEYLRPKPPHDSGK